MPSLLRRGYVSLWALNKVFAKIILTVYTQTKYTTLSSPKTPKSAKGLAASKYADEDDAAPASSDAVEGEHDSSSAALASVRQPSPNLVFVLDHFLLSSSQFQYPQLHHRKEEQTR
jgi:hypothetical protein